MRGLLLLAVFAALIMSMIAAPYAGLLGWAWFSFMHPQREAAGFANDFSFDWYVALITISAWLLSRDKKFVPGGATAALLYMFSIWICVTTYYAIDPSFSYDLWLRTEKSLILVLFVMLMTTNLVRMQTLVWVIVISLGYFAVKGAGFVAFGSSGNVFGPEDSMIYDNNNLGVALSVSLPLLIYLFRTSANRLLQVAICLVALFIVVTVAGTFSRGGIIALAAIGGLLALRSPARISIITVGVIALILVPALASEKWRERMETIWSPSEDVSVQLRYSAWNTAWRTAIERPVTGGGFRFGEQQWAWDRYSGLPEGTQFRAAHSVYFQVLGEHGFVGLIIYLCLVISAIRNTQISARLARMQSNAHAEYELAIALQVATIGVLLGGVSLSMAYYDMFLVLFGMTYALRRMITNRDSHQYQPVTVPAS